MPLKATCGPVRATSWSKHHGHGAAATTSPSHQESQVEVSYPLSLVDRTERDEPKIMYPSVDPSRSDLMNLLSFLFPDGTLSNPSNARQTLYGFQVFVGLPMPLLLRSPVTDLYPSGTNYLLSRAHLELSNSLSFSAPSSEAEFSTTMPKH
jgi:hypothetical protein